MSEKKMYYYLVWFLISIVVIIATIATAMMNKYFFQSNLFYFLLSFSTINYILSILSAADIIGVEIYLNKLNGYYFDLGIFISRNLLDNKINIGFGLTFFSINIKF